MAITFTVCEEDAVQAASVIDGDIEAHPNISYTGVRVENGPGQAVSMLVTPATIADVSVTKDLQLADDARPFPKSTVLADTTWFYILTGRYEASFEFSELLSRAPGWYVVTGSEATDPRRVVQEVDAEDGAASIDGWCDGPTDS